MGEQGKSSRLYDSYIEEEEKYLDRKMMGFWAREKGPIKTLGTQHKGIKVNTIMGTNIGIRVKRKMVTGEKRMSIRRRVVHMFCRGTVIRG